MDEKTCKWVYDEDYDVWETECKQLFCLNEGTPQNNIMKYCPFCGKLISECQI